eukprot:g1096.t1
MPPVAFLHQKDDQAARLQATQDRQSLWHLRCKLEQCRREANLMSRAVDKQCKDVMRLEGQVEHEAQSAVQLEAKTAALLASSPDAELRFQSEGQSLLQLEEAAEDWADAAAVPVDLVLALGRARFGVEEALLKLTRNNEMMAHASEEHDALLLSLHTARQERRVRVAQLATAESALLASRAELGSERAEAALESRSTAMLEAEANDFQAEMTLERSEEEQCCVAMSRLQDTETQNAFQEANSVKASQLELQSADRSSNLLGERSRLMMGVECARAHQLVELYTQTWDECEALRSCIRQESKETEAAKARAQDALLESEAADTELLKARASEALMPCCFVHDWSRSAWLFSASSTDIQRYFHFPR